MLTALLQREKILEVRLQKYLNHHQFLGLLVFFVGMPVLALLAAALCTGAIAISVSWVFGCL